jgi:hypothetical protein
MPWDYMVEHDFSPQLIVGKNLVSFFINQLSFTDFCPKLYSLYLQIFTALPYYFPIISVSKIDPISSQSYGTNY